MSSCSVKVKVIPDMLNRHRGEVRENPHPLFESGLSMKDSNPNRMTIHLFGI